MKFEIGHFLEGQDGWPVSLRSARNQKFEVLGAAAPRILIFEFRASNFEFRGSSRRAAL
jgi:hypothetical protein